MTESRSRVGVGLALAAGIGLGFFLGGFGTGGRSLRAQAGDRWGDWAVASGTVYEPPGQGLGSSSTPQDAIYYLNYKTGQLLACVPSPRAKAGGMDLIGEFAARDLAADFGLKAGETPHFLLTTADIGSRSDGWQPLFVFESTTGQVLAYKVTPSTTLNSAKPLLEIVDRRADPLLGRGSPRR